MIRTGLALGLALALISGCGLRGDLERPVPLFGNPPDEGAADPRTLKKLEEEAKAKKAAEEAQRAANKTQPAQPAPE